MIDPILLMCNSYFHVKKKVSLENLNERVRLKYPYVGGNMVEKCIVINGIGVTGSCYVQLGKFCVT